MILPIVKYPDPVLRKPAEDVTFPLSPDIKKLVKNMIDTVRAADGIGLAAPQVNRSLRIIVVNLEKSKGPLFVLFNPKIVSRSFKKVEIEEGCLSLPGIFGFVRRPKKVKLRAQNEKGEWLELEDDGWVSRIAQHEIDHTNGVLILDLIRKYTSGQEQAEKWKKEKRQKA